MSISTVLRQIDIRIGAFLFKRKNRSVIQRRLPANNDLDDYHDIHYKMEMHEVSGRNNRSNSQHNHHKNNHFLLKFVVLSIAIVVAVLGGLKFWLIPWELQSYNQEHGKYLIARLILENQQNLHHSLLVQLTYLNTKGQWQTVDMILQGNTAVLTDASLDLPGFGIPGGLSGSKLVSIDPQPGNANSTPNDPPVLNSNGMQLNGGTDIFFNLVHTIPGLNALLNANLYALPIGPIIGPRPQCYNIYAVADPNFALSEERAPVKCKTPPQFTQPMQ